MAFWIGAIANGWREDQIAAALNSEYLSRDASVAKRTAYTRRTLAKACLWVSA